MKKVEAKLGGATLLLAIENFYGAGQAGTCGSNNGNVLSQKVSIAALGSAPAFTASQWYHYDGKNRLEYAAEQSAQPASYGSCPAGTVWCRRYGMDESANQWVEENVGLAESAFTPTAATWFDTKNRLVNAALGIGYDTAGNLTQLGGYGFSYDAEGRMVSATLSGATTTYDYDGEGHRVRKTESGVTTVYEYDAAGRLMAEYGGPMVETSGTEYSIVDGLGSTRLVVGAGGQVQRRFDYVPYGEELQAGTGGRTVEMGYWSGDPQPTQRFTGKERDAETGLDYFGARYYSAAQGRFTSPDEFPGGIVDPFTGQQVSLPGPLPYADISDPQTLNKYAYVRNSPLRYVDPDGHSMWEWLFKSPATMSVRPSTAPSIDSRTLLTRSRTGRELSPAGVNFIRGYETFSPDVYDTNNPTIGYGHKLRPGESFPAGISESGGISLFEKDSAGVAGSVNRSLSVWTSQSQFDALVSLGFNIGPNALAGSSLVGKINDVKDVTEQDFTRYNKETVKV